MHPFAPFIQILGKGRHGARSLTQDEARRAMGMMLDGLATPEQIGALLMLIRVREETPEEAAGFVQAVRERMPQRASTFPAVIDWGSYAGKRRHLPWFVLAARVLAQQGMSVCMHGDVGEAEDRLYTESVLASLDMPVAASLAAAEDHLAHSGFAYLPLTSFAPGLKRLMQLRTLLGLRSPVHSVARMLNPLAAPLSVHGIFHRGYERIHQQAACLLHEPGVLVFKGEGGEAEINPEMPTTLYLSRHEQATDITWPALLERRQIKPQHLDPSHLATVWRRKAHDAYGEAAVISTLAAVLFALQRALSVDDAIAQARGLWDAR